MVEDHLWSILEISYSLGIICSTVQYQLKPARVSLKKLSDNIQNLLGSFGCSGKLVNEEL